MNNVIMDAMRKLHLEKPFLAWSKEKTYFIFHFERTKRMTQIEKYQIMY